MKQKKAAMKELQALYSNINEACLNGLGRCLGEVVHEKAIARAALYKQYCDSGDELHLVPVIDVREARHLLFSHPFTEQAARQLLELGYSEQNVQDLRRRIDAEEAYRLRQIEHSRGKMDEPALLALFAPKAHPVCYFPLESWPDARQTQCGSLLVYSEATHLPVNVELLQTQCYLEDCIKNLCMGVAVGPTSRVCYDFYLDRTHQCKLYLFLCIA